MIDAMTSRPIHLAACIGVKSNPHLISHFLEHYHSLGARSFLIVLHAQAGDPRAAEVRGRLAQWDVKPIREIAEYSATLKRDHLADIIRQRCAPADWVIYADVDEFQIYPGGLLAYLQQCERAGHRFVRGRIVDRLAPGGELVEIRPHPTIWEQFPLSAPVTRRLVGGWDRKICAALASVEITDGGPHALRYGLRPWWNYRLTHHLPRRREQRVEVHHFKWDSTLPNRVREKLEGLGGDVDCRREGFMAEYRRLDAHLRRAGRIDLSAL